MTASRYSSRKFVIALLGVVGANWMLFERLIAAADYKAIVLGCIGLYAAGNVASRAVDQRAAAGGQP